MSFSGKVALITGGAKGIGKETAKKFREKGAKVVICDFDEVAGLATLDELGKNDMSFYKVDVTNTAQIEQMVNSIIDSYGKIDILVNNAAEQHPQDSLDKITPAQLERTFRTNIFSYFFMAQAALPHLGEGTSIINTSSVTAYKGSPHLLDYSSTKGAIVSFTRSLSLALSEKKIRVNAVAPGPVWTPLIPSTFPSDKVATFGSDVPLKRAGQPVEIASCYVFLASEDASYMTGQVLHPNGGTVVNG